MSTLPHWRRTRRRSDRHVAVLSIMPRWSRILAVALLLAGWLLVLPRGGPAALVGVVLSAGIALLAAYVVAEERDRPWVVVITLLAVLARDALVGLIDIALMAQGLGWYAPDERVYVGRAAALYQHWRDPSAEFNHLDPYIRSWHVHGMARIYQLVGSENVVLVKVANTTLAVLSALLAYRTMRNLQLGGARWALALLLIFPSVAFWTALTLKDSYVIFFLLCSLCAASAFLRTRHPIWLVVAVASLLPLESVRTYIFVTGVLGLLAIPLALARWNERIRVGGALLATAYILFAFTQPFKDLGANAFYLPILMRSTVAQGARSSFVEPAPIVRGEPGDRIVIGAVGVTPEPGGTPQTFVVQPDTEILVQLGTPVPSAATTRTGTSPTPVVVRPGDIVVIGSLVATPSAQPSPRTVVLVPGARNTVGLASEVDPDAASFTGSLATNFRHLPLGILYTLFAPFPWAAQTVEQFATIPEMLLWYLCLAAAFFGTATLLWRRNMSFAQGFAMTAGLIVVLSLIGANTGTLIRSRAMLIPYMLMLAGIGISLLLERYPQVTARWNDVVVRRGRSTARGPF